MSATHFVVSGPGPSTSYPQPQELSVRERFIRGKIQALPPIIHALQLPQSTLSKFIHSEEFEKKHLMMSRVINIVDQALLTHQKSENYIQNTPSTEKSQRTLQIMLISKYMLQITSVPDVEQEPVLDALYHARAYHATLLGDYTQAINDINAIQLKSIPVLTLKQYLDALANPLRRSIWEVRAFKFLTDSFNPSTSKVTFDFTIGDISVEDVEALWEMNRPLCEQLLQRLVDLWTLFLNTWIKTNSLGNDLKKMNRDLYALGASEVLASKENTIAMFALGYYYSYICNAKDFSKGHKYYKQAADAGLAIAQIYYGRILLKGIKCTPVPELGAIYFQKAVDQGCPAAQNVLGTCYYSGNGVRQSHKRAFALYSASAENGNAAGQYNLGDCYSRGVGVEMSRDTAIRYFRMSAAQGLKAAIEALQNLGVPLS